MPKVIFVNCLKYNIYINCLKYIYKLSKVKVLSKKLYLKQEIINSSYNMHKFWCIMKTVLPNKPTQVLPNYIHEEDQKIDTPLDIADKFNNHFCRVGKALAESHTF